MGAGDEVELPDREDRRGVAKGHLERVVKRVPEGDDLAIGDGQDGPILGEDGIVREVIAVKAGGPARPGAHVALGALLVRDLRPSPDLKATVKTERHYHIPALSRLEEQGRNGLLVRGLDAGVQLILLGGVVEFPEFQGQLLCRFGSGFSAINLQSA